MKNNIEILAPAGSYDAMVAAVRSGANAVYLGSKALNARRNATNFDDEELKEAVAYCHERGVKVHQTLNTLMYNDESDEVETAVKTAVACGVDALIIQDLGVFEIARKIAPEMPLHASTQMAVHNLEGAKKAEELGFSRIVLARELSKEEIKHIAQNINTEIEVFIHGALCMSVSGQCYMSSMIGERSGNRGLCAQPCRLPFQVEKGNEYGLSLKDLSLVEDVKELADIGVVSVKIEGRMKRPEYVSAAVSQVKKAVLEEKTDMGLLRSVFSRSGFTDGYYKSKIDYSMFGTRQKDDVLAMTSVLKDIEKNYAKETPLIPLKMKLVIKQGQPVKLICADYEGHSSEKIGEQPQIAVNKPTTREKAEQSLGKTGGTPYYLYKFDFECDDGLIVPVSELNSLRRDALEEIKLQRSVIKQMEIGKLPPLPKIPADMSIMPKMRARVSKYTQVTDRMLKECEMIIMPLSQLNAWVRKGGIITDKICGETEAVNFAPEYEIKLMKNLKEQGLNNIYCGNLWGIKAAEDIGIKNIHGGFNLNIFNSRAIKKYADMGLASTETSFELNLSKIKDIIRPIKTGIVGYGYLPLMTVRNCPVEAAIGCDNCLGYTKIKDRKGTEFFVNCDGGQSRIFNSVPLYLAERMKELGGLDFITLYFTKERPEECDEIIYSYKNKLPYAGNMTRGLYYRNVL